MVAANTARTVAAFKTLMVLAPELNQLRDELRQKASEIAGCNLDDLSIEEVMKYVELGYKKHVRTDP